MIKQHDEVTSDWKLLQAGPIYYCRMVHKVAWAEKAPPMQNIPSGDDRSSPADTTDDDVPVQHQK